MCRTGPAAAAAVPEERGGLHKALDWDTKPVPRSRWLQASPDWEMLLL